MYAGPSTDAMPIAKPATIRHSARSQMANGNICPMELTANSNAATCIDRVRPHRSASPPPTQAPRAEPSRAMATTKPVSNEPTWKCFWMPTTAPLMTELS